MSDLISRSELLKLFPVDKENPLWHFTGIRAAIEAAPALDAVPVVRCKDCKFRGDNFYCPMTINVNYGSYIGFKTVFAGADNDFCSKGARMDGDPDG